MFVCVCVLPNSPCRICLPAEKFIYTPLKARARRRTFVDSGQTLPYQRSAEGALLSTLANVKHFKPLLLFFLAQTEVRGQKGFRSPCVRVRLVSQSVPAATRRIIMQQRRCVQVERKCV